MEKSGGIDMEKNTKKSMILHFVTILTICALLGYLTHDLVHGMLIGILIGFGFVVIGEGLIGKRRDR